jgi:hypothetical protein
MAFRSTQYFFDRDLVRRSMDAVSLEAMSRAGNSIKVIAQRSMRYRKGPSSPGTPPSSHKVEDRQAAPAANGKPKKKAGLLRRALFSAYDPRSKQHLIGPEGKGKATVPKLLEEGGTTVVTQIVPRTPTGRPMTLAAKAAYRRLALAGRVATSPLARTRRTANYPARPYMKPALKIEMTRYPKRWAGRLKAIGSIRAGR